MKVAFFDAKPYDQVGFEKYTQGTDISIKYFETHLNEDTVSLAKGYDCVCVFVNDIVNKTVVDQLYENGVRMIALRCAGFNNVDLKAKRAAVLYNADKKMDLRKSHENSIIKAIYEDFLGEPNSHKAHELLHTHYIKRGL